MPACIYLIPTLLYEGEKETLPAYILDAVKNCTVFFVENERTARRNLKLMWKEMIIDNYEWINIKEVTIEVTSKFQQVIREEKQIGIMSESGCPGVADPGQQLVHIAQEMNTEVKPLVGPNSILLALMASGMNGQHFQFHGYLPIDASARVRAIKQIESESRNNNITQIFIETPYRNNQLMEALLKTCNPLTEICIAADITSKDEMIKTKKVREWKKEIPELHKRMVVFLVYAGRDENR
ncbi:MAG: SAM-dependent methyltransferase [Flavisolibacter sp.]